MKAHAVSGALYARSAKRSPVLIFSPGGGMIREAYTAQLEDLASHGYVVAAISHPYDASVTIFPGGRQIAYSDKRWPVPSIPGRRCKPQPIGGARQRYSLRSGPVDPRECPRLVRPAVRWTSRPQPGWSVWPLFRRYRSSACVPTRPTFPGIHLIA